VAYEIQNGNKLTISQIAASFDLDAICVPVFQKIKMSV